MKFFDLEMKGFLANGKRGGGRAVSYTQYNEIYCFNARYTHGNSMRTCLVESYKTTAPECAGREEGVHVTLPEDE